MIAIIVAVVCAVLAYLFFGPIVLGILVLVGAIAGIWRWASNR